MRVLYRMVTVAKEAKRGHQIPCNQRTRARTGVSEGHESQWGAGDQTPVLCESKRLPAKPPLQPQLRHH